MLQSALKQLEEMRSNDLPDFNAAYDDLAKLYQQRLAIAQGDSGSEEHNWSAEYQKHYREIAGKLREVERSTIISMRNHNEIGDQVLRTLERELDLLDVRFASE